jgi:CheY-like chemotaxis protein
LPEANSRYSGIREYSGIAVTALACPEDKRACLEAGFQAVVVKPVLVVLKDGGLIGTPQAQMNVRIFKAVLYKIGGNHRRATEKLGGINRWNCTGRTSTVNSSNTKTRSGCTSQTFSSQLLRDRLFLAGNTGAHETPVWFKSKFATTHRCQASKCHIFFSLIAQ